MTRLVSGQKIIPVIDRTRPLAGAESALRSMERGSQFGKLVLGIPG